MPLWLILILLLQMVVGEAKAADCHLKFNLDDFTIETRSDGLTYISAPSDFVMVGSDSLPQLPVKIISVAVPYQKKMSSLEVTSNKRVIMRNVNLASMTVQASDMKAEDDKILPASSSVKDAAIGCNSSSGAEGIGILGIKCYPFLYDADAKELAFVESIAIDINWQQCSKWNIRSTKSSDSSELNIINSLDVATGLSTYPQSVQSNDEVSIASATPMIFNPKVEYLILTTDSLKEAFEELAEWRCTTGVNTRVITMEGNRFDASQSSIYSIKNCLHAWYGSGMRYLLLGGDTSLIPTAEAVGTCKKAETLPETRVMIPTDMYFATFDGDFYWDANNNGVLGEEDDEVDYIPDIVVSRLPVNNVSQVKSYIKKLKKYESSFNNYSGRLKLLMAGKYFSEYKDDEAQRISDAQKFSETIVNDYLKPVWPHTIGYLFDTYSSMLPRGFSENSLREAFNRNYQYALINTHGQPGYWECENSNFDCRSAQSLTNKAALHCLTTACFTADYTQSSCLGKEMVLNPNSGTLSYVGSAMQGWVSQTYGDLGPTPLFMAETMKTIFENKHSLLSTGPAMAVKSTKAKYAALCETDELWRWMYYSVNCIGEPLLKAYINTPSEIPATITKMGSRIKIQIGSSVTGDYRIICNDIIDGKKKMTVHVNKPEAIFHLNDEITFCAESKSYLPKIWKLKIGPFDKIIVEEHEQ